MGLGALRSVCGGFEDGHVRDTALRYTPWWMRDTGFLRVYVRRLLRLFFDLEGTLAHYRVRPHLSFYPF